MCRVVRDDAFRSSDGERCGDGVMKWFGSARFRFWRSFVCVLGIFGVVRGGVYGWIVVFQR